LFLIAAMTYALSGFIALWLPSTESGPSQRPKWRTAVRLSLRMPALWRAMLFTFLGWFLYTQSYASLPLYVVSGVRRPDLLGSVFVVNAALAVVGQWPLSKAIVFLRLPISQPVLLAFLYSAAAFPTLCFFP